MRGDEAKIVHPIQSLARLVLLVKLASIRINTISQVAKIVRPRVVVVKDSLRVQEQQIERVLIVDRDNTKIPIHIPVHRVKVALLLVVVVKDM